MSSIKPDTNTTTILQINNVTKYYGQGSVLTKALNNVSLNIKKGEFTAIMGASGSGKSTLLNVISTIDKVSSGEILIEGINVADMKDDDLANFRRDKLGFVFQDYNLLDTLTISENIALPLNLKKESVDMTNRKLQEVAKILGVEDQLDKFPRELSGGQRQRAACARALITKPALILADEPTGALDSANSKGLMKSFRQMNEENDATILMVTHDAMVGSYANRVLFLKDGQIWNELIKGDRNKRDMYNEILSVMATLGGEADAL